MVKVGMFLPLLFTLCFASNSNSYKDAFNYDLNSRNNNTITSVATSHLSDAELRMYSYDDFVVDEISDNALTGSQCTTLMISKNISIVHDALFASSLVTTLNYTGSVDEYNALGLTYTFDQINYYALDEGFINYWNDVVRPDATINICNMTKAQYAEIMSLYKKLNNDDLEIVNNTSDKANEKIGDSIKELNKIFTQTDNSGSGTELNQTSALTFIIVVAVLGMTSICIFFLLKERNFIQ